jgi:hypothetical protein
MLYFPKSGNPGTTSTISGAAGVGWANGITVTANTTTHQKGAYSTVVANTQYVSYGITVGFGGVQTSATTNTRMLVDIAVGDAGSEQVVIPNLMAGTAGLKNNSASQPQWYHFPIVVPRNVRISARAQASISGDTVIVDAVLYHSAFPGKWYGSRVTAYTANTTGSTGLAHTAGTTDYAATTQLTASTTNPIKYMQVGHDLGTDTTANSQRRQLRIAVGNSTNYVATDLPIRESTTFETVDYTQTNFILSHMNFSVPAASYLGVGAWQNGTAEVRNYIIYGVD